MRAERLADLLVTFPGAEVRVTSDADVAICVTVDDNDNAVFDIIKRPSEIAAQTVRCDT